MTAEVWRDIPGYPGYRASDQGRIGSCLVRGRTGEQWAASDKIARILKSIRHHDGYAYVAPRRDGKHRTIKVARLAMLAFHGPRPEGTEICHGDNNRGNDHLDNLRYDTHQANMQESVLVGKVSSKLTLKQAKTARVEYAEGNITRTALARKNGVSWHTINALLHGARYTDAGGPILN